MPCLVLTCPKQGFFVKGPLMRFSPALPPIRRSGLVSGGSSASGVLFDSSTGDSFVDMFSHDSDASLTVSASSITFNHTSSTPKTIKSKLKDSVGNVLKHCYDDWTITGTFTVQSLPFDATNTSGVMIGMLNDSGPAYFGLRMRSFGSAYTDYLFGDIVTNGSGVATLPDANIQFAPGDTVTFEVRRNKGVLEVSQTLNGGSENSVTQTMVFAATSVELPRVFSDFSIQWMYAHVTLTQLKIELGTPSANYICIGDSLTQGRFASSYANGWTQKLLADYPSNVLCLGAPGAIVNDWAAAVTSLEALNPTRAFIMLGTNDYMTNRTLGQYQTDMAAFIALVETYCPVVLLTIPPTGFQSLEDWNAWLATLGKPIVDIYDALLGTSYALDAAYNSGDGIHFTDAGHTQVYNTVKAAIIANGWAVAE